jgi:hypothetical protein
VPAAAATAVPEASSADTQAQLYGRGACYKLLSAPVQPIELDSSSEEEEEEEEPSSPQSGKYRILSVFYNLNNFQHVFSLTRFQDYHTL